MQASRIASLREELGNGSFKKGVAMISYIYAPSKLDVKGYLPSLQSAHDIKD
jgi:hypothetical protein